MILPYLKTVQIYTSPCVCCSPPPNASEPTHSSCYHLGDYKYGALGLPDLYTDQGFTFSLDNENFMNSDLIWVDITYMQL
jgi:hypothetical protein